MYNSHFQIYVHLRVYVSVIYWIIYQENGFNISTVLLTVASSTLSQFKFIKWYNCEIEPTHLLYPQIKTWHDNNQIMSTDSNPNKTDSQNAVHSIFKLKHNQFWILYIYMATINKLNWLEFSREFPKIQYWFRYTHIGLYCK